MMKNKKELETIHYFSNILSKIFDFDELLETLVDILGEHFKCRRVSLILLDGDEPLLKMAKGFQEDSSMIRDIKLDTVGQISSLVLKHKKSIAFNSRNDWKEAGLDLSDNYRSPSFLATPIINNGDIIGIINIAEPENKRKFLISDKNMLEIVATQIGFSIVSIKMHKKILNNEIYKTEMEIGRRLQLSLLPEASPHKKGIDISLCSFPAILVGGDYYDFIDISKDKLAVIIGDISGKGVSASIIMASLRSLIHSSFRKYGEDLVSISEEINTILYSDLKKTHYFSTLFIGVFDIKKKKMEYINLGHNYPIMYRNKKSEINELADASTNFLGFFEKIKLRSVSIDLDKNDYLLFYTDGLIENKVPKELPYSEKRLEKVFSKACENALEAVSVKEAILNDFKDYSNGYPLLDDYTIIVIKIL